ncbi:hypothetical protein [Chengkuizengella axinellae]|uniref:Uncharacterized protein n=1 Tax=Chengkuizengella axinellae TaxID=3064388 RepID=A0ABT9IW60_9BACL|nr:hypothetical protein [Chengkuizengella sp. 2205SS18-9]MDP5273493.1 hypothetical protein [Chengkuizengella sp. 2205SS18-9]
MKNEDIIYSASTEVVEGGDGDQFIFSQQYVDKIEEIEKNVTYKVIANTTTGETQVFLQGPITFTGSKINDDK